MIQAGCTDGAPVTVLSDGEAGLRAIPREVAAKSEHSLDWLPLAMRFQHVIQVARGLSHDPIRTLAKRWVTGRMDRRSGVCGTARPRNSKKGEIHDSLGRQNPVCTQNEPVSVIAVPRKQTAEACVGSLHAGIPG